MSMRWFMIYKLLRATSKHLLKVLTRWFQNVNRKTCFSNIEITRYLLRLLQNLEKISQKISFVRDRDVISNLKPHSIVLPVSDQWKRGTYIEWEIKKKRARISLKRAYINYVCLRVRCKLDEVSRERHAYSKVNIHHAYSELNMQHATMSLRNSTVKGIEPPRFLS